MDAPATMDRLVLRRLFTANHHLALRALLEHGFDLSVFGALDCRLSNDWVLHASGCPHLGSASSTPVTMSHLAGSWRGNLPRSCMMCEGGPAQELLADLLDISVLLSRFALHPLTAVRAGGRSTDIELLRVETAAGALICGGPVASAFSRANYLPQAVWTELSRVLRTSMLRARAAREASPLRQHSPPPWRYLALVAPFPTRAVAPMTLEQTRHLFGLWRTRTSTCTSWSNKNLSFELNPPQLAAVHAWNSQLSRAARTRDQGPLQVLALDGTGPLASCSASVQRAARGRPEIEGLADQPVLEALVRYRSAHQGSTDTLYLLVPELVARALLTCSWGPTRPRLEQSVTAAQLQTAMQLRTAEGPLADLAACLDVARNLLGAGSS